MNSILQDRLDIIKELCKRYKVRSLYSFGSVNTSRFTEHSDIDLLIEFDPSISLEIIIFPYEPDWLSYSRERSTW